MESDSIQLWSSFNNGIGYNIGFDFLKLDEINRSKGIIASKVVYDVDKQKEILYKNINYFKGIYNKYYNSLSCLDIRLFSDIFLSRVRLFCCFFKNPLFENDKEFRIVFYNYQNNEKYINPKYRIKGSILIPYIDTFEFDKTTVKSITIGPMIHSDIAMEGVTYLLNDLEYNITKIDIKNSKIPLRY